jgi:hypothetical protein
LLASTCPTPAARFPRHAYEAVDMQQVYQAARHGPGDCARSSPECAISQSNRSHLDADARSRLLRRSDASLAAPRTLDPLLCSPSSASRCSKTPGSAGSAMLFS